MSRFVTQEGDKFIEEIDCIKVCKHKINELCCNEKSEWLGSYVYCDEMKYCEDFEEDRIIGDD